LNDVLLENETRFLEIFGKLEEGRVQPATPDILGVRAEERRPTNILSALLIFDTLSLLLLVVVLAGSARDEHMVSLIALKSPYRVHSSILEFGIERWSAEKTGTIIRGVLYTAVLPTKDCTGLSGNRRACRVDNGLRIKVLI
jgi:hypothetical protein